MFSEKIRQVDQVPLGKATTCLRELVKYNNFPCYGVSLYEKFN